MRWHCHLATQEDKERRHLPLSRGVEREEGKERERERGKLGREIEEKWGELRILTSVLACM